MEGKPQCQHLGWHVPLALGGVQGGQCPQVLAAPPMGNKGGCFFKTLLQTWTQGRTPLTLSPTAGSECVISDPSLPLLCSTRGRCRRTRPTWQSPHSQ